MQASEPLGRLSVLLSRLPGVGRRSAERMAMKLARDPGTLIKDLIVALRDVGDQLRACSQCGSMTTKTADPCALCADPHRDSHLLCVVEDPSDIASIEQAGSYRGRYHALMGKLSPMRGEGLKEIHLDALLKRVKESGVEEVILALNSDVESDATASFLAHSLEGVGVKVSRLAYGLPAGSAIAYSDPVTLARALQGRQPV